VFKLQKRLKDHVRNLMSAIPIFLTSQSIPASFTLINVDFEDESRIVTVKDPTPLMSGAYGDVFVGDYILREGDDIDPVDKVVAKRNRLITPEKVRYIFGVLSTRIYYFRLSNSRNG
jgi:hypothetical protein